MSKISRRELIRAASLLGLAAFSRPVLAVPQWITGKPKFIDYPFKLGVASGDPTPTGVVLWTRLAPSPLDRTAVGADPIPVGYEVAADDRFRKIVRTGHVVAHPENAHAVHVDVQGLESGRPYWYRFRAGDEVSPVGRAMTAPAILAPTDRFRFAVASCQHYEQGYYTAYRDMVAQNPDLVVHLGDYIYEFSYGGSTVRRAPVKVARTLDEYRLLYATYKQDPDLQAAHAHTSWYLNWDDHEVANDYAGIYDAKYEPTKSFLLRRAAAYKAYFEHQPLRRAAKPIGPNAYMYQRAAFGDLLEFNMLDTRQYRDDQPCQTPENGGWRLIDDTCKERLDPKRTILGMEQERWLLGGLGRRPVKWNVITQGMLFSKHDFKLGPGEQFGSEYWDGYVGSRDRVLDVIEKRKVSNPVILGGDVHAYYVCDVKKDFDDPKSATVASEFVGTSITSGNSHHYQNVKSLPDNPHIKLYDGRYRGYILCDVDKKRWQSDLRIVKDITSPELNASVLKSYVVEDGVAGPQEA